ncbi:hypothetical protein C8Q79DRAFT_933915 [Trametes meyenii]|nr:hypothetical protein C8Q79DRAFT_933915 [Trametes meyenii]
MSERGVGKPWTTYEDNLLIQAVAIHGENDNWKVVALSVPGRTNKACRKRWLHSLSPNVKKTAWTPEEDQLLLSLYAIHGTKWSVIARNIPGRTDDACSKRYREALDPSLKRDDWTVEEDSKLMEAYSRLGGKWGLIGQELSRSGLGCRNRWRMLERKRVASTREQIARGEPSSTQLDSAPQWTPGQVSTQDTQPWDGGSPQYIAPSMLFSSSPTHTQESRAAAYLPEEILSGAHLAGMATSPLEPPQFQFGSSSLSGALSHPGSVAHSPNPHGYYPSPGRYSPSQALPQTSDVHTVATDVGSHDYEPGEYRIVSISGTSAGQTASVSSQQLSSHRGTQPATHIEETRASHTPGLLVEPVFQAISDSPASPSEAGSPLPLDTPPASPPIQEEGLPSAAISTDSAPAPSSYYRTDVEKAQQPPAPRRPPNPQRPTRLSSLLPATTDASVLAYACGHRECWPADAVCSMSAFATSKELSDHSKVQHGGDLGGNKPFRCALTGCEKSWKSVNGLQYHLQISKVHFQQALATRGGNVRAALLVAQDQDVPGSGTSSDPPTTTDLPESAITTAEEPLGIATPAKPKCKLHPCPHPGCGKQYKQLSGLRYHLSHGHVEELPMQLDVVPPALARIVAEKGQASSE